ncbi:MAG: pyruvate kinase [Patescibacteria group bacterium]|jgi:pyruvate kinase
MVKKERRTKIIATIGPASSSISVLIRMVRAGMSMARLNFSHGKHEEHAHLIRTIRAASKKADIPVGILGDLQGPRIRIGELPDHGIELRPRQSVILDVSVKEYEPGGSLPITYALQKDVKAGDRIFIDDGLIEVEVKRVQKTAVHCLVKMGGILTSHKGMNLPDTHVTAVAFTKKDREDLLFGLEHGIDWVALSFVATPESVASVREIAAGYCRDIGRVPPKIIAKIERKEAVDHFHDILEVVDGVMLARGDLGIEVPFEEVPLIQKEFTEICRQAGKPIVIATHMLDSMSEHPRATRAEVSDVANAVIDHADAVMLSAETAMGKYPDIAVQTMASVITEVEASRFDDISFYQIHCIPDIATAFAQVMHTLAEHGQIQAIATSASFGDLAQKINIFRPNVPIIIACESQEQAKQYLLRAGFQPVVLDDEPATFIHRMERLIHDQRIIDKKSRVAYVIETARGDVQLIIRG